MNFPSIRAFGTGIELLVAVYIPAFVTAGLLRPRVEVAIPLIIAITFLIAFILILELVRLPAGIAEFGFRIPKWTIPGDGNCPGAYPRSRRHFRESSISVETSV